MPSKPKSGNHPPIQTDASGPHPITPTASPAEPPSGATHQGFLAQYAVVTPGDESEYQRLCQTLFANFQPSSVTALLLLEQLVIAAWNLRRLAAAETALAAKCGGDPLLFPGERQAVDRLHRDYAAHQRTYLRLTRELTLYAKPAPTQPAQTVPPPSVVSTPPAPPPYHHTGRSAHYLAAHPPAEHSPHAPQRPSNATSASFPFTRPLPNHLDLAHSDLANSDLANSDLANSDRSHAAQRDAAISEIPPNEPASDLADRNRSSDTPPGELLRAKASLRKTPLRKVH